MIEQIGLPLRGRPILLITRMITDRTGLHSVLLPLLTTRADRLFLYGCPPIYATISQFILEIYPL